MNKRQKRLDKLDAKNQKALSAALLHLIVTSPKAPESTSQILIALPAISKGVLSALDAAKQRAIDLADADVAADGVDPSSEDYEPSAERKKQTKTAVKALLLVIIATGAQSSSKPYDDAYTQAIADADKRIKRLSTTETFDAYNYQWVAAITDAPGKFIWDATLDKRTCSQCESLHGKTWATISEAKIPPAHPLCRCVLELI